MIVRRHSSSGSSAREVGERKLTLEPKSRDGPEVHILRRHGALLFEWDFGADWGIKPRADRPESPSVRAGREFPFSVEEVK